MLDRGAEPRDRLMADCLAARLSMSVRQRSMSELAWDSLQGAGGSDALPFRVRGVTNYNDSPFSLS